MDFLVLIYCSEIYSQASGNFPSNRLTEKNCIEDNASHKLRENINTSAVYFAKSLLRLRLG